MKLNVAVKQVPVYTHEGARAVNIDPERQLRRSVNACLLWESQFYEDGKDIAARIAELIPKCRPEYVAAVAFEARTKMKLRHVPLLVVREMARTASQRHLVSSLLRDVIQRPDEITEFLAIYWKDGKQKLSAQVKKGLAQAFHKFNEYQFAKYDREGSVRLRDALFLCHAKPETVEQEVLFKKIVDRKLETPDTWEVALSGGADKKSAFERLMAEKKFGALAFIRNLRNMAGAGVSKETVSAYAQTLQVERVLPFRFITAARIVPQWEDVLEPLMMTCLSEQPKIKGRTVLLVDVSGSMDTVLSAKSEATRMDAAFGVGVLLREVCEEVEIFTFSDALVRIPARRGFALRDTMKNSQHHSGTRLAAAVNGINAQVPYDRIIVITDEQSHDGIVPPKAFGYVVNVASNKNGVGYGPWTHIDGWSESVIDYIREFETETA